MLEARDYARMIVVWPVEGGWHYRDEVRAVLLTKGFDQFDTRDRGPAPVVRSGASVDPSPEARI